MQMAIDDVKRTIANNEGGPFGACIVCQGKVISTAHNTVLRDKDPTCHAEINAIRLATKQLGTHDLSNCVIYSTTEPCPMCFSAIHWANIDQVIFGTNITDVQKLGFRELEISNQVMKDLGNSHLNIISDFERDHCQDLLNFWSKNSNGQVY